MLMLSQSAAYTVKIGPFVDDSNGTSAETGLTITQADIRLSKNGGNMAQKSNTSACVHDEIGYYDCNLATADTDTVGRLQLMVNEAGALPVWHEYMVVPSNVYNSLIGGTDYLAVDAVEISSNTAAADNVEANIANLDGAISSVTAAISGLNDISVASVTAGVDDLLRTVTISEMAQAAPPATPTFEEAVMYVYMALRNEVSVTATIKTFSNSAGTVIFKKTLSDDGSTYTEAEAVSGP